MKHIPAKLACCFLAASVSGTVLADTYRCTNSQGQLIECTRNTPTTDREGHPVLGTLAGGAVGGLVGNQFGKGTGNTAATAAGVVGGAAIGHHIAKGRDEPADADEHCYPVDTTEH